VQVLRHQLRECSTSDSHIQCLVIAVLEVLACSKALLVAGSQHTPHRREHDAVAPSTLATEVVQDLVETASDPRGPERVVQRCLLALLRIGQAQPRQARPGLGPLIALTLREGNGACRALCLELIAQSKVSVGGQPGRDVVGAFLHDSAHVVRVACLRALQSWRPVPLEMYGQAVAALSDDNALVRQEAVVVVGLVAVDHAEPLQQGASAAAGGAAVRIADSCFMQVCGAFFDSDSRVRVAACKVLGLIPHVSPHYLVQTLTKRMLSFHQLEDVEQSAQEGEGDFRVAQV
jgi:hypothetical protein